MVWMMPSPFISGDARRVFVVETFLSSVFTYAAWLHVEIAQSVCHKYLLVRGCVVAAPSFYRRQRSKLFFISNYLFDFFLASPISTCNSGCKLLCKSSFLVYQYRYIKPCNTPSHWKSGIELCIVLFESTTGLLMRELWDCCTQAIGTSA